MTTPTPPEGGKLLVRVGDKFKRGSQILEVTAVKPGGKVEMIDRAISYQVTKWAYQVREMEAAS